MEIFDIDLMAEKSDYIGYYYEKKPFSSTIKTSFFKIQHIKTKQMTYRWLALIEAHLMTPKLYLYVNSVKS